MKKVCLVVWVYGRRYLGYIPLYLYSVHKSYPEYDVKVVLEAKLPSEIQILLERYGLLNNVEIYDKDSSKIAKILKICNNEMEKRCIRWMIGEEFFSKNYDYVYFGDVDVFIVRENPTLLQSHIEHMCKSRCLFSNSLRISLKDFICGQRNIWDSNYLFRLTGLHFVDAKKYFHKVKKIQLILKKYMEYRVLDPLSPFFTADERL